MAVLSDKPYYAFNDFIRQKFGEKCVKIAIDAGFTCPNRDGTLGFTGCAFCSGAGSGDFAQSRTLSIAEQIKAGKRQTAAKWTANKYIAYFQAYTNTYAPVSVLEQKYREALSDPQVCALAIATRPDCLDEDIVTLLKKLNQTAYIWVELGLQSANEDTAQKINRCYSNACFEKAVEMLKNAGIDVVTHLILGLPGETETDMLHSVSYVSHVGVQGIKLQLLHILENTLLSEYYKKGTLRALEKNEYIDLICKSVEILDPKIVIHRLTGDGNKKELIAPLWSLDKRGVLNAIHKQMRLRGTYQGKSTLRLH